jgi:hypothetical protein
MATTMDTLELTSEPQPQKPIEPIKLHTRRDYGLLTRAIEHEIKDLEGLAKKNQEEGYWQESRVITGDVAALKFEVLPQVREQREIPFATIEGVQSAAKTAIRDLIEKARTTKMPVETLLDELGRRIGRYGRACADIGYEAGVAARVNSSEALTMRAIRQLYANPDEDQE